MLIELRVQDLGVIADLSLVLGPGMTAITGETGAGKTLVVEALDLLVGGRADRVLVRPGAAQAVVEGRFGGDHDEEAETVLGRVVPASGRSRASLDGRMVPLAALVEAGADLVDLHGQHAHQSLLAGSTQRAALDAFAGIDPEPLRRARAALSSVEASLDRLGGDERARAREIDLLRFQVAEIEAAGLGDPDEDGRLEEEEDRLADASSHREAAAAAREALVGDGGGAEAVGTALAVLRERAPFADLERRLRSVEAELADLSSELRGRVEALEDDPERLAAVRGRRQLLRDLARKYGDGVVEVLAFADDARRRLAVLEGHGAEVERLTAERARLADDVAAAEAAVGAARRAGAPRLARVVEEQLARLGMPRCRLEVSVGETDPGDDVAFLLGANPGEPALPLAKVASGGELARAMLATRLALTAAGGPAEDRTLVFDEVDAGIGGEAALAVGRALADLGRVQQVLVVTHLAQVAAFADHHVVVRKQVVGGRTVASAQAVRGDDRLRELSRMLSGQPDSAAARRHARDLLRLAQEAA